MTFDLDARTVALSAGEFADFSLGPRESIGGGGAGVWRAQLGTHWHNELRARAVTEHAAAAAFEIPIAGRIVHRGWTFTLTGRIDQLIRAADGITLREIKSVTRPLPADETELRRDYPGYFIQLATYAALARNHPASLPAESREIHAPSLARRLPRAELVFVETDSGLAQTIALTPADEALFRTQLERVAEFLDLRLRARERLRGLRFRPAFAQPRPGQETTLAELTTLFARHPLVLFEAPTGFGKTGVLLEFALGQLRSGHFDRALYLTSKSTGQLQVVRTLAGMTQRLPDERREAGEAKQENESAAEHTLPASRLPPPASTATAVAAWHVRNKSEHCVNPIFHCTRDACAFLAAAAERWPASGLARFYVDEQHARDLDTLRAAGRHARICPYEITRAALGFNDVWIGDYNYVFAPRNRGLFFDQPGFTPARTLLLLDEAHNLPSRVADAYSHAFTAADAFAAREELHRTHAPAALVNAWDHWCHFLHQLRTIDTLPPAAEDDACHLLGEIAKLVATTPLDYAALGPRASEALWEIPSLVDEIADDDSHRAPLSRLWWCPRDAELALTCLDAAPAIGATLREFGGVVLASATLTPIDNFSAACGLDLSFAAEPPALSSELSAAAAPEKLGALTKRATRKLYTQLTSAADLLRVEEARDAASPALLRAHTPWRDGAYDVAFDARVDTTFQHRSHHYTTTAATVGALSAAASRSRAQPALAASSSAAASSVAVFFPSYAYAEAIARELAGLAPALRVALQPKLRDLAAQSAWVDASLLAADALFLVLGSSFAESIDALGGRVTHAMIVGPALPEVNAVQRAKLALPAPSPAPRVAGSARDAAFRRVYQIPGMTKVNQALGRLVRAPAQRARILFHCRRFLDPSYASLLAAEYRIGTTVADDVAFAAWLG
ncbi:MAG TPA: helicase C-terminal domain-containing protein [Opitutaceae bacterium]|nr:helicase C-terminal domain-containing protein [Opitutaceae bacterium]